MVQKISIQSNSWWEHMGSQVELHQFHTHKGFSWDSFKIAATHNQKKLDLPKLIGCVIHGVAKSQTRLSD